jgi:hypothetical protein
MVVFCRAVAANVAGLATRTRRRLIAIDQAPRPPIEGADMERMGRADHDGESRRVIDRRLRLEASRAEDMPLVLAREIFLRAKPARLRAATRILLPRWNLQPPVL